MKKFLNESEVFHAIKTECFDEKQNVIIKTKNNCKLPHYVVNALPTRMPANFKIMHAGPQYAKTDVAAIVVEQSVYDYAFSKNMDVDYKYSKQHCQKWHIKY